MWAGRRPVVPPETTSHLGVGLSRGTSSAPSAGRSTTGQRPRDAATRATGSVWLRRPPRRGDLPARCQRLPCPRLCRPHRRRLCRPRGLRLRRLRLRRPRLPDASRSWLRGTPVRVPGPAAVPSESVAPLARRRPAVRLLLAPRVSPPVRPAELAPSGASRVRPPAVPGACGGPSRPCWDFLAGF